MKGSKLFEDYKRICSWFVGDRSERELCHMKTSRDAEAVHANIM